MRDKQLMSNRDIRLCQRYYYWTEIQRLRFDDTLKVLSQQEFFISEDRILRIIKKNIDRLPELASCTPSPVKKPKLSSRQLELFVERTLR